MRDLFDQLDELERDIDLALDTERDRVGFAGPDTSKFCPRCFYRWDLHRTDILENVSRSPHGCPSETIAVLGWGRQ